MIFPKYGVNFRAFSQNDPIASKVCTPIDTVAITPIRNAAPLQGCGRGLR